MLSDWMAQDRLFAWFSNSMFQFIIFQVGNSERNFIVQLKWWLDGSGKLKMVERSKAAFGLKMRPVLWSSGLSDAFDRNLQYKFNKNIRVMSIKFLSHRQGQKVVYHRQDKQRSWFNPENSSRERLSRTRQRSVFLTQFDKMQKTKALWRNLQPLPKPKKVLTSVQSWKDLDRLKIQYRTQMLRKKSQDEIFQENMNMILKIEETPPEVDTWNNFKPKRSPRSSSEQLMIKNLELIKKIEETEPKVEDWNYYKPKKSPRAHERSEKKMKIFQENLKIIDKIQSIPPKVDAWGQMKPIRNKRLLLERSLQKQKLFEQNMKIIQKVESIPPKVESWADIRSMRKKAEQKKAQFNRSDEKLERMKKIIEESEYKLMKKQLEDLKKRRLKTLPDRLPSKLMKQREEHSSKAKMMTLKIQKAKCAVNCWTKQDESKRQGGQLKRGSILALAEERKKLKHSTRNLQTPLNFKLIGKKH